MKVLVIGSGGREHAIAYALNKSEKVSEVHAIPGNPGMSEMIQYIIGDLTEPFNLRVCFN